MQPHSQQEKVEEPFYQNWTVKEEDLKLGILIGRGASSEVYKATLKTDTGSKEVAAKRLQMYADPEEATKQRQEMKILRQLSHRNIVNFIGTIESPGKPFFIITELAAEGSLYGFMKKREACLPSGLFCDWGLDAAHAIEYLQDHEVTHRDIKSPNYLIIDRTLKLCDFGIARNIEGTIHTVHLKGSIQWMAPEVFIDYAISFASDIFSYGVVLWELLTGKEPYKGMMREQIMFAVGNDGLRPEIPEDCPEVIRHLLQQCWDADRKKRPSIKQIVDDLEKYKEEVEIDQDQGDLHEVVADSNQGLVEDLKTGEGDAKMTGDDSDLRATQDTFKEKSIDGTDTNEDIPSDSHETMTEDNNITQEMPQSDSDTRDSFAGGELPPTPPEDWETSEDRLGGKLYVVVRDFKARHQYEISVKKGELVELTEIDNEDGTWHVRVTLGTSLDGYTYTKRVGWIPSGYCAEYTGPDKRKSRSLTDISDVSLFQESKLVGSDRRLSRSITDISDEHEIMMASSNNKSYMSSSTRSHSNLYRRTGSWLGGTHIHPHLGHQFQASSLHIPVRCSFCKKWCSFSSQEVCEYQCLNCKLVVHKGCHDKILNRCRIATEDQQCPLDYEDENERLCMDLPHRFLVHTWKVPTRCSHCGSLIMGIVRQGLKCAECKTNIHHKCKPNVANSCSTKHKELSERVYEVKREKSREKKKGTIKILQIKS